MTWSENLWSWISISNINLILSWTIYNAVCCIFFFQCENGYVKVSRILIWHLNRNNSSILLRLILPFSFNLTNKNTNFSLINLYINLYFFIFRNIQSIFFYPFCFYLFMKDLVLFQLEYIVKRLKCDLNLCFIWMSCFQY